MRVFYGFDDLPRFERAAATVGSFDGVHCGHVMLLRTVTDTVWERGGESVVFTFEPHPRITLGCDEGLQLLTTLDEKTHLLERLGIDNLVVIPFDREFSQLPPDVFLRDYLMARAGIETLVVGFDHHFGRNQQGNRRFLESDDSGMRFVEVAECEIDNRAVSSTVVRRLIAEGRMADAARMLAHPYVVIGEAAAIDAATADRSEAAAAAAQIVVRVPDPLKLLPAAGDYEVRIDGIPAVARIAAPASAPVAAAEKAQTAAPSGVREIIIYGVHRKGRVVITF